MGFFDELNKMVDAYTESRADAIEQKTFNKKCLPVITFDHCVKWAMNMKKEYPQIAGAVISVKDNPDPRNENDLLCVIVGAVDAQTKIISMDGVKGISTIFHGKTVDSKLVDFLNGNEAAIYKF